MKTPAQLREEELQEEREEKIRYLQALELRLEHATKNARFTSKGGKFTLSHYDNSRDFPTLEEYFSNLGWDVRYFPYTDDCFSMTTKSSYTYTVHRFLVTPLNKQGIKDEKMKSKINLDKI